MKIAEHIMSRCATESFNDTSFIHQDDRTFVRSIWTDSTKLTSIHVGSSRWHHSAYSFGVKLGMPSSRHGLVLVGLESKAVKSSLEVFHLEKFVVMMSQSHPFLCYLHIFDNESHKKRIKRTKGTHSHQWNCILEWETTYLRSLSNFIQKTCLIPNKMNVCTVQPPCFGVFWNGDW